MKTQNLVKAILLLILAATISCKTGKINQVKEDNKELATVVDQYFNERMQMYPLEATTNGDNRFNNLLPANFTDSYQSKLIAFFKRYQASLDPFKREQLNDRDKITYDILRYEIEINLEGLIKYHCSSIGGYMWENRNFPFDQFNGVPILLGSMGGGTAEQPFKTLIDYDNWLQRASAFSAWTDSALVYFKKGMAANYVLPKAVVIKMIPQMQAMVTDSAEKSLFYEPVRLMPASFSEADKKRLITAFTDLINQLLVPSYNKLAVFLQTEYLPKARITAGINALPDGENYYSYLVKYWTTTNKTPDEIYRTGI